MQGVTYLVSDTMDHDLPVFVSDSVSEIAKLFGTTARSMSSMICRKQKVNRRYLVERVSLAEGDER